jgi:hypothetical protein
MQFRLLVAARGGDQMNLVDAPDVAGQRFIDGADALFFAQRPEEGRNRDHHLVGWKIRHGPGFGLARRTRFIISSPRWYGTVFPYPPTPPGRMPGTIAGIAGEFIHLLPPPSDARTVAAASVVACILPTTERAVHRPLPRSQPGGGVILTANCRTAAHTRCTVSRNLPSSCLWPARPAKPGSPGPRANARWRGKRPGWWDGFRSSGSPVQRARLPPARGAGSAGISGGRRNQS